MAIESGATGAVTSTITLAECLVEPYRKKDAARGARYMVLLRNFPHLAVLRVTDAIAERAAFLRANHRLKTPDALQISTALLSGCRSLLTNDEAFHSVKEIEVLVLDDFLT
jgi:predicted nucleic acid-binding protein